MNEAVSQAACFRHVVFPDSIGGYGRVLNATPPETNGAESAACRRSTSLSPEAESLFRSVFFQAGLSFHHYKPETLGRRLPACLRALRASSPAQARAIVRRSPELAGAALDALLIGVTSFFRDESCFAALRQVLPELVGRWRVGGPTRPLRVWSAACSSGAELYSVALLLLELGALWPGQCELLGTDCRPEAVARAAAATFEPAALRGVPPALLRQYFVCAGDHFRVRADIRSVIRWRRGDVLADPQPGPWDLVLCRNLAIYLQPQGSAALWSHLAAPLRPGGVLMLGKAERPLGVRGLASIGPCLYRKDGA